MHRTSRYCVPYPARLARAVPVLGVLALACLLLGACPARAQGPVAVVASFTVLADMVRNIGGDLVSVRSLVGPNGDAHTYEPTPADARAVREARLVVVNGLGFEGWMDRLVKTSGYKGPVCTAAKGVKALKMEDEGHGTDKAGAHGDKHAHETDPHAWHNLANGRIYVANIAAALAAVDPANAEAYRSNAEAYSARLAELDAWARSEFASVPPDKRRMITSHDALGYFGAAYGIGIMSPVGFSTDSEPSAGEVARLIRQIRKDKITAVFVENVSDPRLVEQIARESGATPGGELYSDALSAPDGPAPTYIEMVRNNVAKIAAAMRGR